MTLEQPPKDIEQVESFEDTRDLPPNATELQIQNDKKENLFDALKITAENDDNAISQIKHALSVKNTIQNFQAKKSNEVESWDPAPQTSYTVPQSTKHHSSFRNKFMAGVIGVASILGFSSKAKAGDPTDSLNKKPLAGKVVGPEDSLKKNTVEIYTKAKTKEGGVTPTGLSNSFLENSYGITEKDIYDIAATYGFRSDKTASFQADLVDYLLKNNPEIIKKTLETYAQTAKGAGIARDADLETQAAGLKDGLLGVRTAFMMSEFKKTIPETPPSKEDAPQPKGGYVINVRGDEPGSLGTYYFFENEKDFMKATDAIGSFSSREVFGNGTGQATINMNEDVFLTYHAKGNAGLLGQAWTRNKQDQKTFVAKNTTAHFSEGLATTK